jgi:hypothetical protein
MLSKARERFIKISNLFSEHSDEVVKIEKIVGGRSRG